MFMGCKAKILDNEIHDPAADLAVGAFQVQEDRPPGKKMIGDLRHVAEGGRIDHFEFHIIPPF